MDVDLAVLWVIEETLEMVEVILALVETLVEDGAVVMDVVATEVTGGSDVGSPGYSNRGS